MTAKSSAAASLWPDPPRVRPLRFKEEPQSGQRIYLTGDTGVWRWAMWMHCGRTRYAVLHCDNPACRDGHIAGEERVRVDA